MFYIQILVICSRYVQLQQNPLSAISLSSKGVLSIFVSIKTGYTCILRALY